MTNRGTAYILYYDAADAEMAVSSMHEAQVDGAVLKVSIVLPRRAFSRSPPPARRPAAEDRPFSPRRHPPNHGRNLPGPSRRSPRRHVNGGASDRHDIYRPRSLSRSPSPRRSRASIRSDSGSPPRRRSHVRRHSRNRRRRSPSYPSYSSRDSSGSERSRSPSRSRGPRSSNKRR
jgi:RNA-binding protein with serine-rich domain 1